MFTATIIAAALGAGGTWYSADKASKAGKAGLAFAKDQANEQAKIFSTLLILGSVGIAAFAVVYAVAK